MAAERPGSGEESGASFVALIGAARAGCSRALGSLLERSRPDWLRIARRRLADRATAGEGASDVVQEAAIVAGEKLAEFRGERESGFRAWVGRIVEFKARNARRRGRVRAAASIRSGWEPADSAAGASTLARREEESALLAEALASLSEQDRTVLRWLAVERLTSAEIGRRLGMSDVAAGRHCKRAAARVGRSLRRLRHVRGLP